ncbi:MAG: dephospho-CoA kinase [Ignavibacteriae bacterium HGW-Ignavibacteriae-1]|jgi:dephospho-CoA kinase|nr:MAG: dephospho-CoA kinase [Ignavibacteriae bacterium HGW-Ignavibacteriae-1]
MEEINDENDDLLVIGLTGGIGAGKSVVASIFAERGFVVINTDDLAKDVMATNSEVSKAIRAEFGEAAFKDGKLNSQFLGSIVFGDNSEKLDRLNRIVHPPVIDAMIAKIEELHKSGEKVLFVESALIYSAGIDDGFDYVIAVVADDELRIKRLTESRSINESEIRKRMSTQTSKEQLISLADFTIENNGTINDLSQSANFILAMIQSLPPKNFQNLKENIL